MKNEIQAIAKRTLSLGISIIMIAMTSANVQARIGNSMGLVGQDNEIVLNRIGVSAKSDANAYMTRGDFAVLAVQALGVSLLDGENVFDDVNAEQSKYLNTAATLGIVSVPGDKLFYPDRIITKEEAASICLRMLNYDKIVTGPDAYPNGYMAQAYKLNLFDGVSSGNELTGEDAAVLLYNTIATEYLDQTVTSNGGKVTYNESGNTYLEERFGVVRKTGTIESICGSSMNKTSITDEDKIIIDSTEYLNPYYSSFKYYTMLGRKVEYFTKDTKDGKVIIYVKDKSDVEVVDFKDVRSVKGFDTTDSAAERKSPKLVFENENGKNEDVLINSDATVLVNGEKVLGITNSDFEGDSGKVTFVDNNKDNIADVVAIEQYTYYRVSYYDATREKLELDDDSLIELSQFKDENVICMYDDKETGRDILVEDAVLSVMCSYKADGTIDTAKKIVFSVKTQIVEGAIEYITDENKFGIAGKEYKALNPVAEELKDKIGRSTVFYLGNDRLIVDYQDFNDKEALIYGYLVLIGKETKHINSKYSAKIFTEDEKMEVFDFADELRFTGVYNGKDVVGRKIKNEDILKTIQPKQLIRYKLNEDKKIELLELPKDYSNDKDYKGFDLNRFSLDYASNDTFIYQRFVGSSYKSNSNTVYFYVSSTSTDEDDFSCYNYMDKGHQLDGAKVKIYDSDTFLQPTVVVIEDYPDNVKRTQDNCGSWALVTNKRVSQNKDGDWVTTFDTYNGVNFNTYRVESDDIKPLNKAHYNLPTTVSKISEIKNGDILKTGRRKDGEIDRFIVVNEYDPTQTASDWSSNANDFEGQPHLAEVNYAKGKITSFVPKSYLKLDCSEEQRFCFGRTSVTYWEYNVTTDTLTRANTLPRLNTGDYVWLYAVRNEISMLVRYVED